MVTRKMYFPGLKLERVGVSEPLLTGFLVNGLTVRFLRGVKAMVDAVLRFEELTRGLREVNHRGGGGLDGLS